MCFTRRTRLEEKAKMSLIRSIMALSSFAQYQPSTVSHAARSPLDAFSYENHNINTRNEAATTRANATHLQCTFARKNARSEIITCYEQKKNRTLEDGGKPALALSLAEALPAFDAVCIVAGVLLV